MNRRAFALGVSALALAASGAEALGEAAATAPISRAARALWRRAVVVDCNLAPPVASDTFPQPEESLAVARSSGVSAIKTSIGGFNASFEDTLAELAFFQRLIEAHPQVFAQIRAAADIEAAKRAGKVGIIFSFESVAALEDKLDRIDLFRNLGVRVMQLSYNLPSPFGAGVLSPQEAGLTELGREAIARMNAAGVALDLSHANPATTAGALDASSKPVLITHAGCSAVHPHPRNKTDEQLRAIAQSGGVVGIYDLFYLAPAPRQPNLDDYLAHMAHALDVCGEDHVGIGSDTAFDSFALSDEDRAQWLAETQRRRDAGVAAPEEDGRLPLTLGLNRADRALVIADGLMRRGYRARAVEKVLGANFVRAFTEIW
jgi:membrane dipeptidase